MAFLCCHFRVVCGGKDFCIGLSQISSVFTLIISAAVMITSRVPLTPSTAGINSSSSNSNVPMTPSASSVPSTQLVSSAFLSQSTSGIHSTQSMRTRMTTQKEKVTGNFLNLYYCQILFLLLSVF